VGGRVALVAGLLTVGLVVCACGKRGSPAPPLPRGPLPMREIEARQLGERAVIAGTLPRARGAKPAQQPAAVELLRVAYPPGVQPPRDPDAFRRRGEVVAHQTLEGRQGSDRRIHMEDAGLGALPGGGEGWTLRYALRVRDRRGRPSPLAPADDLIPLAVADAPAALATEPTADGVRLAWSPPAGPAGVGFNVYRRGAGETDWPSEPLNAEPLAATDYLDSTARTGARYYYTVRVALAGEPPYREGREVEAVEALAEDRFAPQPPQGLVAVQEGNAVRLFWNVNRERDVAGYRVHRGVDGGAVQRIGPERIEKPSFLDEEVTVGQRLVYEVSAVDRMDPPNESPRSAPVAVVLELEPEAPSSPPGSPP
jgi:hypothetical protein